jgi:hypothetical protein
VRSVLLERKAQPEVLRPQVQEAGRESATTRSGVGVSVLLRQPEVFKRTPAMEVADEARHFAIANVKQDRSLRLQLLEIQPARLAAPDEALEYKHPFAVELEVLVRLVMELLIGAYVIPQSFAIPANPVPPLGDGPSAANSHSISGCAHSFEL